MKVNSKISLIPIIGLIYIIKTINKPEWFRFMFENAFVFFGSAIIQASSASIIFYLIAELLKNIYS